MELEIQFSPCGCKNTQNNINKMKFCFHTSKNNIIYFKRYSAIHCQLNIKQFFFINYWLCLFGGVKGGFFFSILI